MSTRFVCTIGIVLVIAMQAPGLGQAPAIAPQQPTFKAATTLIEVDAIVKDSKGRFVPDLTAADFDVREDGVPQQIEQMYMVTGADVKTATPVPLAPTASPVAATEGGPPAPPIQRTFVFLFDEEHIEPGAFDRAKKAALAFMTSNFREGDIGGVVDRGTMINNRLTNVRAELQGAIAGLKPHDDVRSFQIGMREWPRLLDFYEVYLIADKADRDAISRAVTRACSDDSSMCQQADVAVPSKAQSLLPEVRASGQRTIRTVGALCDGLAKLPGRKTVILLSGGFFAEDSWADLRGLEDRAARASVRIYSLDTRGLNRGSASSDIIDMGPHSGGSPSEISTSWDVAADAPNSLAVDTGGLAIRNENDFGKALTEIANDTSNYYILGYRSTNTAFDGKFRSITVRVKRPRLAVRARRGYLAAKTAPAPMPATAPAVAPANAAPATPPAAVAAPAPAGATPPAPSAPSAGAVGPELGAAAPAPANAIRLQPDVKERLAALGKVAAEPRTGAPPENVLAQARAGWAAYEKGDLKNARIALSAAAAHPAAPAWVHYALGWTEFAVSDYIPASTEWERVRAAAPEFEPVYFDLADSYLQQREYGKALESLRAAEKRWPNDVEVYNAIGVVQTGRGALSDAIKTFEKGVAVNPNDPTACYNLARTSELRLIQSQRIRAASRSASATLEDKDRAIEYYRRTVALGKQFVEEARAGLRRLGAQ